MARKSLNTKRMWAGIGLAAALASGPAWANDGAAPQAPQVQYSRDLLGRIVEITYPDGTVLSYTYNLDGTRTETVTAVGADDMPAQITVPTTEEKPHDGN